MSSAKPAKARTSPTVTRDAILDGIRHAAGLIGRAPSRSEFEAQSGFSEYQVLTHFPSWRQAVRAAGLEPDVTNVKLEDSVLLEDWGALVRRFREIPTRHRYRREGRYSPGAFERHFGPWSAVPGEFLTFAKERPEWQDVLALLPRAKEDTPSESRSSNAPVAAREAITAERAMRHTKLEGRPTYGNPIDFRGLRHEPVNESGVVFLFGMVAKELGYLVEAVQAGFPDCEAKRQVAAGRWQRVRIEFEFESRNFRDHGHACAGCDVIVCWRHNWPDCPAELEIVELSRVIQSLAKSED